jgi:predicted alpha/beta superfamily hydrolase
MTRASLMLACAVLVACGASPAESPGDVSSSSEDSPTTIDPSSPETTATTASPEGTTSASTSADDADTGVDTGMAHADLVPERPEACIAFDAFADAMVRAPAPERESVLADYVADVMQSTHGFPLVCDGRLVALLRDDSGGALSITGDFADWDPEIHPLARMVDGFDLWVADIEVPSPLPASGYKFVRDGAEYFADPWSRRHTWDEFGELSLTDARTGRSHVERYLGFSDGGDLQPRTVTVLVPADALADDATPRPVVYMHDGQNLFAPDAAFGGWRVMQAVDDAVAAGEIEPVFVVGIANTSDRFDEYTPWTDDLGAGPVGGRADEYAQLVGLSIKPFIDDRYPTRPGPESTAIAGSSLGGLVSLYVAAELPDVFGHAASLSGTLGWGQLGRDNPRIIDAFADAPPQGVWIYLDSGGNGPCPGGGSDNYCETVEMRDVLAAEGWTEPQSLVFVHAPGATHDEAAWAARMPGLLRALGDAFAAG